MVLSFLNGWRNWGLERLNDPPKTTQGGTEKQESKVSKFRSRILCTLLSAHTVTSSNFITVLGKHLPSYAHFHSSSSVSAADQFYRALWTHSMTLSQEMINITDVGWRIESNRLEWAENQFDEILQIYTSKPELGMPHCPWVPLYVSCFMLVALPRTGPFLAYLARICSSSLQYPSWTVFSWKPYQAHPGKTVKSFFF